jgi:hypothetical protein
MPSAHGRAHGSIAVRLFDVLIEPYYWPGLSPFPYQASDAKQGETQHEQLKRRWHLHRAPCEVHGHVGSSGRRHREDNQEHRKAGAQDVLH